MEELVRLLGYGRVLTIFRREDDFVLSFADVESDDGVLYFLPDQIMVSREDCTLTEALATFYEHQMMISVQDAQA